MKKLSKSLVFKHLVATLGGLENYSFEFVPSRKAWIRRRFDGVAEKLFVDVLDYSPKYILEPALSIRFSAVEDIFHRTSRFERKYWSDTPTISFALSRLRPELSLFRYEVVDKESLKAVAQFVVDDFTRFALPFLETNCSMEAVEKLINATPEIDSPYYAMPYLRYTHGLILAKLVNPSSFEQLTQVYRSEIQKFAQGFYLDRFEDLVDNLNSTSDRSGE